METVSTISAEKATSKHRKIHRSRIAISKKIVAFDVLANLQHTKRSAREISGILEVSNSTMRSWQIREDASEEPSSELTEFFSTPAGLNFLQRMATAANFVIEYGPSGVRGFQEYLRLSGLNRFIASSNGTLQAYSKRIEQHIVSFGMNEEKLRAPQMKPRKITVGLDEMFRGRHPCLVAIEVVSNYILLEKFTEDRKAETWKQEINAAFDGLPIEVGQVVSDLCGALTSYTKDIGAQHSPDLFHGQYELAKATAAPLTSQEKAFEKAVDEADAKVKKMIKKHGQSSEEAQKAISEHKLRIFGLEERKQRKERVQKAKKAIGVIYHPIDLESGRIQTADSVENQINAQLQTIKEAATQAGLSQGCMERIAKAGRAFDGMVAFLRMYLLTFLLYVEGLQLLEDQKQFFLNVVFPLAYLKMILKRQNKEVKERVKTLIGSFEAKIREGPWPNELKDAWMKIARERVELFQRSTSCVEGRNGMLSLLHHRCHRLSMGKLKALTVVHNYHIRRQDGSTAAERFFEQKHGNLFESIVENVRIPGGPYRKGNELPNMRKAA